MEPATITATVDQLAFAIKTWRETAEAENWPSCDEGDVEQGDHDSAEYLFGLLTAA